MKLFVGAMTLFLVCNLSLVGQENTFTFKGQVHSYGQTIKGVVVEVFEAGDLVHETITNGSGNFALQLDSKRDYMVEISMDKLQSKTIWINTRRTKDLGFKVPVFAFDVDLKKEKITPYKERN